MKSMLTAAIVCGLLTAPAALGAQPPHPGSGSDQSNSVQAQASSGPSKKASTARLPRCARGADHAKQVTFVLRGVLSAFSAATATQAGSVTIAVTGGNCFARAFKATTLTFALSASTRVVTGGSIVDGDQGAIQVRGPKALDGAGLAKLTPRVVLDTTETTS